MKLARCALALLWVLPASALAQETAPTSVASPAAPPAPAPAPYGPPPGYAPPGYYPPPGYYGVPPPTLGPDPTARRHDGFYLRMGLGLGWGYVKSSGTFSGIDLQETYKGWGPAYELLIGGTIARGLVLGGGFVGQDISDPSVSLGSNTTPELSGQTTVSGALGVGAMGPFLDWFPNEREGLHFGTMLGLALLGLQNNNGKSSFGVGGSLWGGYDFWVGDQWSLGAEARIAALSSSRDFSGEGTLHDKAITLEALFTAVYH